MAISEVSRYRAASVIAPNDAEAMPSHKRHTRQIGSNRRTELMPGSPL
jgi:hypothetical protein